MITDLCEETDKNSEKRKRCIDITTPDTIFYNKFLIAENVDEWTLAYTKMFRKRFQYCRRKGNYKEKLFKAEKMYLKIQA
jgi:hypothetical protein